MIYKSISIRKAVQMIEERELLLPHIQRSFVWKQDRNNNQVKRFLDSIMRGYPLIPCYSGKHVMIFRFADLWKTIKRV